MLPIMRLFVGRSISTDPGGTVIVTISVSVMALSEHALALMVTGPPSMGSRKKGSVPVMFALSPVSRLQLIHWRACGGAMVALSVRAWSFVVMLVVGRLIVRFVGSAWSMVMA